MLETGVRPVSVVLSLILISVIISIFFALPLSAENRFVPYRQEDHGSFEE